ncbi:hypothetical protein A3195_16940 [Candidatus Thiodiazotropha endoloripes]|uniref:hypothetical protein n=1 Tax=Candidatus Thiodiazotropha endoloripes TaxID=1818881 RepID=UPI00083DFBBD|nr:hypothetical protein [Candidatus Thiodiazotropha endoloripes]ODB85285.1 hypothetical protein A3195_16940 [Candidatus Thiodiazotropha endoloripes]
MLKNKALSREELFALIWERPTTEVAHELGISDVALGKLCRQLQVPKPPRGYWARVASGRTPKRPPLPAYRAEIEERLRKQVKSKSQVLLSKLQLKFLNYALEELANSGVNTKVCELAYDGIRSIPPELVAKILIVIQTQYEKWLADREAATSMNGGLSSLSNLVGKLQPHAKEQLLIFRRKTDGRHSSDDSPTISVRATPDFLGCISHLSRLARDNGLTYAVADMSALDHAWSVKQVFSPKKYSRAKTELCVSSHEVWIRADVDDLWSRDCFETVRIPLREVCPIDLMPANDKRLPGMIRRSGIKPYADRLQALHEAKVVYEALVEASHDVDTALPNERLALLDRLWFSRGESGPFMGARQAWRQLEADLEFWEQELESETVLLCQDVLGIEVGDIVLIETGKSYVRVEVERMDVLALERCVIFVVWGLRYRKNGLPGKRTEQFRIELENDKSLDTQPNKSLDSQPNWEALTIQRKNN